MAVMGRIIAVAEVFGRLAAGPASVAIVPNGGRITLDVVEQNLDRDGGSS